MEVTRIKSLVEHAEMKVTYKETETCNYDT